MKLVAIHQPNWLPWPGYFLKMAVADVFVFYDNCPLNREGYSRRVRIEAGDGSLQWLSLRLPGLRNGTAIDEVALDLRPQARKHLLNRLREAYGRLPHGPSELERLGQLLEQAAGRSNLTLATLNKHVLRDWAERLCPRVELVAASTLGAYQPGPEGLAGLFQASCAAGSGYGPAAARCRYLSGKGGRAYLNPEAPGSAWQRLSVSFIDAGAVLEDVISAQDWGGDSGLDAPLKTLVQTSTFGLLSRYGATRVRDLLTSTSQDLRRTTLERIHS